MQAVLTRLNSPEMERSLIQNSPNSKALASNSQLRGLDDRYLELAEMLGQDEVYRGEFQATQKIVDERKEALETVLV